jgi:hypothetical protein
VCECFVNLLVCLFVCLCECGCVFFVWVYRGYRVFVCARGSALCVRDRVFSKSVLLFVSSIISLSLDLSLSLSLSLDLSLLTSLGLSLS